ncbi:MAG: RNase III inhibitor, partial [Planctomycetaceae bacterium]|nr:RNase III inhibitor [Planctomycetaceae bacterium]
NSEAELLASAYQQCLSLACEKNCRSIAFPSLSTGAYGFPLSQAASIALTATMSFLQKRGVPELVRFVLFNRQALEDFERALGNLRQLIEP